MVATKIDALDEPERLESLRRQVTEEGRAFFAISAVAQMGTQELINAIAIKLDELKQSSRMSETLALSL